MPAVSVIVPAYRTTSYIAEALDSAFAQSFQDFDVIVVNDGCPDSARLEQVLEPYRSRIRYIRKENGGPGSARNAGILATDSPFVAMLDSDDVWDPEYLAVQMEMFRRDPSIDVIYPNAVFFGDTSEAGRTFMDVYPSAGGVTFLSLLTRQCMVVASATARRDVLIRAGLYDTRFSVGEDFELWLRVAKMSGRIVYHKRPLVRYRRRAGSQTQDNLKSLEQVRIVLEKVRDTLTLEEEERQVLGQEMESNRASTALERGRQALRARNWATARRNLEEANRHFRKPKMALLIRVLRFAPWLLGPVIRWRYGRTPRPTRMETVSLLLAAYTYPPVIGGSEIEAQRVCASLVARGHRVEVLTGGGEPMPPVTSWVDPRGIPVRIFGNRWREPWKGRIYGFSVAWHLWQRRRDYQLVYFLMPGLQVTLGAPVARLLGKRVFMKFSGSNTIRPLARSRMGLLQLRVLRKTAERIMVLNPGMAEEAQECGLDAGRLCWMPNPVDTALFAPLPEAGRAGLRQRLGISPHAQVVLFVGRLAPEKELTSLLDAFARLGAQHPDACLVVVGDGSERDGLERRAAREDLLSRVRFTGMVSPDQVGGWMQIADVFALVSSLEGFPCALAEAMSCGLPSVVSDIPANRQLIRDGVNGLLVSLGDPDSIAAGMDRLLRDPDLRTRLGRAARQDILDNYSIEKVLQRYESLFGPPAGSDTR